MNIIIYYLKAKDKFKVYINDLVYIVKAVKVYTNEKSFTLPRTDDEWRFEAKMTRITKFKVTSNCNYGEFLMIWV